MDLPHPAPAHPSLDTSPSPPPNLFCNPDDLDEISEHDVPPPKAKIPRRIFPAATSQFRYPPRTPFKRSAATIQMVHNCLRGIKHSEKPMLTIPMAVAIGPYHRHRDHLCELEEAKEAAVLEFCEVANQSRQEVREKISSEAISSRACYQQSYSIREQTNDSFVDMMLLDGCFLLQFMVSMCTDYGEDPSKVDPLMSRVEVQTRIDAIARDVMLLENQIPWSVLDALMKIRPGVPIDRFLDLMASAFDVSNERANNSNDLQGVAAGKEKLISDPQVEGVQQQAGGNTSREQEDGLRAPDHLLALFHRRQVGAAHTNKLFVPRLSSLSSTAVELAEMGVKLIASETKKFGDMSLKKRQWRGSGLGLFGSLSLAPVVLNDLTACWLINMAAYEAILGAREADNFAVSSYIFIIAILMNREEDVHELRSKGIVHSTLSNQGTLDFFKWAAPHLRVDHRYYDVFKSLDEYRQERWVWIGVHRFFPKIFKTIAAILSVAGVLAGLFKTILSPKQPGQVSP